MSTAEPRIAIEAGRTWVLCASPGCGRKRLGEIAPDTRIVQGWVSYYCSRCKTTYRLSATQSQPLSLAL